jgi:hypothetical protein
MATYSRIGNPRFREVVPMLKDDNYQEFFFSNPQNQSSNLSVIPQDLNGQQQMKMPYGALEKNVILRNRSNSKVCYPAHRSRYAGQGKKERHTVNCL